MGRTAQCSNSGTGKRFYLFVCSFICLFVCLFFRLLFILFIYLLFKVSRLWDAQPSVRIPVQAKDFTCSFVRSFVCLFFRLLFILFTYLLFKVSMLWDAQPSVRIPVQARDFTLVQNVYTSCGALPASYSVGTVVLSRCTAVKGVTLTIQPPVSAKVKNAWIYLLLPLYTLREWIRKLFSFYLFICILLTLRRLTSYIYGAPILDVSRSHTTTQHSR